MANSGTPMTMPGSPNRSPPTTMANSTHSDEMPMDWPRILGPMKLPSSCWMMRISTAKISACSGSTSSRMNRLGMAPMNGPNTGMMLVMPTNTLMSSAKSSRSSDISTKVSTPMMAESMTLPT